MRPGLCGRPRYRALAEYDATTAQLQPPLLIGVPMRRLAACMACRSLHQYQRGAHGPSTSAASSRPVACCARVARPPIVAASRNGAEGPVAPCHATALPDTRPGSAGAATCPGPPEAVAWRRFRAGWGVPCGFARNAAVRR